MSDPATTIKTRLIVCSACHHVPAGEKTVLPMPQRDGGQLLRAMQALIRDEGLPVKVQASRCLGCCDVNKMCGALLQTPGKDGQVLGGFVGPADAPKLMAFVRAHLATRKRVRVKREPTLAGLAAYFLIRLPAWGRTTPEEQDD